MNQITKKVVKPISLYGHKVLIEMTVEVEHIEPEREVSGIIKFIKGIIIKKILSKVVDMGELKITTNAKLVKDPTA